MAMIAKFKLASSVFKSFHEAAAVYFRNQQWLIQNSVMCDIYKPFSDFFQKAL